MSSQQDDDWDVHLPSLHGGVVGVAHTFFGAPEGSHGVVVYEDGQLPPDCARFAVLKANPSTQIILNPRGVICTHDMHTVSWLNEVLFATRVCILDASSTVVRKPVLLVDLANQAFSLVELGSSEEVWVSLLHDEVRVHDWKQDQSQAIRSIAAGDLVWMPLSELEVFHPRGDLEEGQADAGFHG